MAGKTNRPKGNFELYSWFFMRVSGLFLVLFVLVHLAYVHFIHGVDEIDFNFVAERWASPTWRILDIVLLTLALAHGGNGVRILIDDYVQARGWRTLALTGLYTLGFALVLLGAFVILTFRA